MPKLKLKLKSNSKDTENKHIESTKNSSKEEQKQEQEHASESVGEQEQEQEEHEVPDFLKHNDCRNCLKLKIHLINMHHVYEDKIRELEDEINFLKAIYRNKHIQPKFLQQAKNQQTSQNLQAQNSQDQQIENDYRCNFKNTLEDNFDIPVEINKDLLKIIEYMHYNPDNKKYHNMYLTNIKDKIVKYREDNRWFIRNGTGFMDDLIDVYSAHFNIEIPKGSENKSLRKKIFELMYQNKELVLETDKEFKIKK